jgi:mono/diheme cytochrome c family protein
MKIRRMVMLTVLVALVCALTLPAMAQGDAAATYKAKCAMCHGADGKGKPSMANTDLVTGTKGMTEAQVEEIIAKGKAPKMPAYSSLGADTVKALAKYVKSLQ